MSVYSQAWHDTPPATRDFYVNFSRQFTYFTHKWPGPEPEAQRSIWYTTQELTGALGYHIAQRNWGLQSFLFGHFTPGYVYIAPHDPDWKDPSPGPAYDFIQFQSWGAQWLQWADDYWPYPRPASKVRRSYWTGKPKRRQNL